MAQELPQVEALQQLVQTLRSENVMVHMRSLFTYLRIAKASGGRAFAAKHPIENHPPQPQPNALSAAVQEREELKKGPTPVMR